jgi:hypothetical protein
MVSVRVPNPGPPLLIIPLVGLKITPASALGAARMQVEMDAPTAAVENFLSTVEVFILRKFPQNK